MSADIVTLTIEGGIARIALNDPDRRNGLSPELVVALVERLNEADRAPDVRCAILHANGPAFSAGGNLKRMIAPGSYPDMTPLEVRDSFVDGIQRIATAFAALSVPVIAAVGGPAIGAGTDLACMCDLRIGSERASFVSSFVRLGLIPGDGGAWFLPRAIGRARAAEMILTGAAVDAEQALAWGLISALVPHESLLDEALARAELIAAHPPHAPRMAKRLLRESADAPLGTALELAAAMQALALKTGDQREAVLAMLEKRAPDYAGR
ncbi:MAG: enoyl-CoA hydratase-related protein [Novosphingobium sp.]|nr:enoyl-CoA hydratase-related protein [Novosphingobium sp.]